MNKTGKTAVEALGTVVIPNPSNSTGSEKQAGLNQVVAGRLI